MILCAVKKFKPNSVFLKLFFLVYIEKSLNVEIIINCKITDAKSMLRTPQYFRPNKT